MNKLDQHAMKWEAWVSSFIERTFNWATMRRFARFFAQRPSLIFIVPLALMVLLDFGLSGLVGIAIVLLVVMGPFDFWGFITGGDFETGTRTRQTKTPTHGDYKSLEYDIAHEPAYKHFSHNIHHKDD
ncbi:MAG: hypothetical protein KDK04_03045 [Candidatus Competibacteraceae bacterium]|nr:hypothetical protein [Candidatus Competibacteraceae bacterium]